MSDPGRHIAIVDDDAAVLKSLSTLLKAHGYDTTTFRSAEDFELRGGTTSADCLLLDVRMPGMSGLDLQAALKEKRRELPIVFMTAHGDIPMAVEAMRQGAVEFVEKPFSDGRPHRTPSLRNLHQLPKGRRRPIFARDAAESFPRGASVATAIDLISPTVERDAVQRRGRTAVPPESQRSSDHPVCSRGSRFAQAVVGRAS